MPTRGMQPSGRERALAYLRDTVLADPTVPGTFLNEGELARRIGVSRTPVREALLLLVADGLVDLLPGRGAYVPPLSPRQIRELMEVRGLFERHAATEVIRAGTAPVEAMRAELARQRTLATSGDVGSAASATEFIARDMAFHQLLIDAAGNDLLAGNYAGLRVRQRLMGMCALFRAPDRQLAVCAEHGEIVDALAAADPVDAGAAIDRHIDATLTALLHG